MRSLSFRLAALCVLIVAVAGCQIPSDVDQQRSQQDVAQSGQNTAPFHAKIHNTIQVVPPFPPPVLNMIFEGDGKSSPFGMFMLSGTSQVDFTVFPFSQTTNLSFKFRDGNELHLALSGTAIEDPPGEAIFNGEFTVVGGTGRFANASGSGTYAGAASLAANTGQFEMDGVISGFGGN